MIDFNAPAKSYLKDSIRGSILAAAELHDAEFKVIMIRDGKEEIYAETVRFSPVYIGGELQREMKRG